MVKNPEKYKFMNRYISNQQIPLNINPTEADALKIKSSFSCKLKEPKAD